VVPLTDDPLFEAEVGLGPQGVQVADGDVVCGRDPARAEVGIGEVLADIGPDPGQQGLGQHDTGVPVGPAGGGQQGPAEVDAGVADGRRTRIRADIVGVRHQAGDVAGQQAVRRAAAEVADGHPDGVDRPAELADR
jgi:hypothetical protein